MSLDPTSAVSGRPRALLLLAAAVVVVAGLRYAEPLLVPFLFAALVVAISSPIAAWASHRGLPAVVGALLALVVDAMLIGGVGLLITFAAGEVQEKVPAYTARASAVAASVAAALQTRGVPATEEVISRALGTDTVVPVLGSAVAALANAASGMVMVLLVVFFALCEIAGLGEKVRGVLRDPEGGFTRVDRIVREIQKYLLVKTLTSLLVATLVFAWLKMLGVGLALLLASLMFLLHFVPNLGAAVATLPAVAVALLDRGAGTAFAVLLGYLGIVLIVGSVIEPRVLGRALGVSPLVVLLGLLFWGWLWGPAGALLSVPLTMIAKIILENDAELAWMARCAEPGGAPEPLTRRIKRSLSLHPRAAIGIGSAPPGGGAAKNAGRPA